MRRTGERNWCLDHVVPQARGGGNSYRNLVSCCVECNSSKGERPAEEYLRELYRERRLDARELSGRLRALDELADGKLKPVLPCQASDSLATGAAALGSDLGKNKSPRCKIGTWGTRHPALDDLAGGRLKPVLQGQA